MARCPKCGDDDNDGPACSCRSGFYTAEEVCEIIKSEGYDDGNDMVIQSDRIRPEKLREAWSVAEKKLAVVRAAEDEYANAIDRIRDILMGNYKGSVR